MKKRTILYIIGFAVSTIYTYAGACKIPGTAKHMDGGILLCREHIEIYWNDWIAYPLMEKKRLPTTDQADILIKGEGKTVQFYGVLSINCNNGKHGWDNIPNNYTETLSDKSADILVPKQAISSAISMYCK